MVSITLSVPKEVRKEMKEFPEVNWSGFIRKCIESKSKELAWKKAMLEKLKQEDNSGFTDWTLREGSELNSRISERLKKEGLL